MSKELQNSEIPLLKEHPTIEKTTTFLFGSKMGGILICIVAIGFFLISFVKRTNLDLSCLCGGEEHEEHANPPLNVSNIDYNTSTIEGSVPTNSRQPPNELWGSAEISSRSEEDYKAYESYIKRFASTVIEEQSRYGIPASIKMGQALLESNAGRSRLAKKGNAHFGMKCFSKRCKRGHCMNANDDHHKDYFLVFESAWQSFRAHSEFLVRKDKRQKASYGWMVKKYPVGSDDYIQDWCKGLKESGYATSKTYAKDLYSLIQEFQLYRLDKMSN